MDVQVLRQRSLERSPGANTGHHGTDEATFVVISTIIKYMYPQTCFTPFVYMVGLSLFHGGGRETLVHPQVTFLKAISLVANMERLPLYRLAANCVEGTDFV